MNDKLIIGMKDGTSTTFEAHEFTDYQWSKEAFIVIDGKQWIAIYNWDSVEFVRYVKNAMIKEKE